MWKRILRTPKVAVMLGGAADGDWINWFLCIKNQFAFQTSGSAPGQSTGTIRGPVLWCLFSTWSVWGWHGVGVEISSNWNVWELRGSCWDVNRWNDAHQDFHYKHMNVFKEHELLRLESGKKNSKPPTTIHLPGQISFTLKDSTLKVLKMFEIWCKNVENGKEKKRRFTSHQSHQQWGMVPNRAAAGILFNKPWI